MAITSSRNTVQRLRVEIADLEAKNRDLQQRVRAAGDQLEQAEAHANAPHTWQSFSATNIVRLYANVYGQRRSLEPLAAAAVLADQGDDPSGHNFAVALARYFGSDIDAAIATLRARGQR